MTMMKSLFLISTVAVSSVYADVYMHNPRGSNDRNCRTDNDQNRRNGNRLFDSQNNAKGGYSCPLARPFDCYKILDDTLRDTCNQKNAVNPTAAMVNDKGVLHPEGTITPRMYYYEGSILPIEWTSQHGCGGNSRVRCDIVIQYACEDTLTDVCDSNQGVASPGAKCGPRDGFPVTNSLNTGNLQRDAEATATIPDNNNNEEQSDYRYGRHETLTYYKKCTTRERNKGLFAADQNINGNTARFTRQNNNGNRNGLECPEESEYWPYWHHSPWKDIAVLTSDISQCAKYLAESQNVKSKNECNCPNCAGDIPNNERGCIQNGGTWEIIPAHGIPAPECVRGPAQRENHLGMSIHDNVAGISSHYNWTIPTLPAGAQTETCILRLRYNISTIDANMVSVVGDAKDNGFFSPLKDRTNNEPKAYKGFTDILDETLQTHAKLGLAVNTNQYGRVFQDRSYTFSIRKAPVSGECANKRIYNVNVRGKRGNIVQTYPAVEYDFVPNHLELTTGDCIHLQWTGSDYNPDQNPNNGYGGPSSPLNLNEAKADRHNLVQVPKDGMNAPVTSFEDFNMFAIDLERKMNLAFIGQPIDNPNVCKNITEIKEQFPNLNQDARDRLHYNCGKLSGAPLPYFDGGLVRPASIGTFYYMSTRDNSFTNRDMKGTIVVAAGLSPAESIGTGVAVGAAVLGAAILGAFLFRKRSSANGTRPASTEKSPTTKSASSAAMVGKTNDTEKALPPPKEKKAAAAAIPVAAAAPIAAAKSKPEPKMTCTALHAHEASEPGELSFNKGDKITIIKKDPSGWWEGTNGKARGIFPANYVKED